MPRYSQNRLWLVPVCIVSLSMGFFIIFTLVLPEFNPDLCESLTNSGLHIFAFNLGLVCVLAPILLLRICVEIDRVEGSEDEDDRDLF